MTFLQKLSIAWEKNNSLLCVGLDTDKKKIPGILQKEKQPIFTFNKHIIDSTADLVCAYKPQIAYYSAVAAEDELLMTIEYIHTRYPEIPVILDAKRGDIGATAELYSQEVFVRYAADAVTVNPYLGGDTLEPFLAWRDRGIIILCKTSNPGSADFQNLMIDGQPLYMVVAQKAAHQWNRNNNVMLVVAATHPKELYILRNKLPTMPFLVPGIGAQGGNIEEVVTQAITQDKKGLIINSSRAILYASNGGEFADAARKVAVETRDQINLYR